jgi:hypothetical protein
MSWTLITKRNSRKNAQKAQKKRNRRMDTNQREGKTDEPQIDTDGEGAGPVKVIGDVAASSVTVRLSQTLGELGRVVVAPGLIGL